jgi:predicted deacylase
MFMYACSQGIPSIMITNEGHRRVEPEIVQPLIRQCLNVMRYLEMIPGEKTRLDRSKILKGVYYSFSTKGGFIFNEVKIGDWLKKDQVISRIYNVFGEETEVIRCPYERALLVVAVSGVLYPGETVAEYFLPMS